MRPGRRHAQTDSGTPLDLSRLPFGDAPKGLGFYLGIQKPTAVVRAIPSK